MTGGEDEGGGERRVGGEGGGEGGSEGGSSLMEEWEASDTRAMLEEEKDRRMRAEEELNNLQVCYTYGYLDCTLVYIQLTFSP